jgi:hypothetical protein
MFYFISIMISVGNYHCNNVQLRLDYGSFFFFNDLTRTRAHVYVCVCVNTFTCIMSKRYNLQEKERTYIYNKI